jgi:hypothetical protein
MLFKIKTVLSINVGEGTSKDVPLFLSWKNSMELNSMEFMKCIEKIKII